jgi:hypothetical protein
MATLTQIAKAMGGDVRGNYACFPTPGHSESDRGSTAELVASAPDGGKRCFQPTSQGMSWPMALAG